MWFGTLSIQEKLLSEKSGYEVGIYTLDGKQDTMHILTLIHT